MKCPACNGTGTYESKSDKAEEVKRLRDAGLTIRQIQQVMGWKSTSVVVHHLKMFDKLTSIKE